MILTPFDLAFLAALALHELTHFVILKRGGAQVHSVIRYKGWRAVASLGLGWGYEPSEVSVKVRLRSYLWANLVEILTWACFAALIPSDALVLLGAGAVMLMIDWYFPHLDGWNYRKLRRAPLLTVGDGDLGERLLVA